MLQYWLRSSAISPNSDTMRQKFGITKKFAVWYLVLWITFYGTILFLCLQIQKMVSVQSEIVDTGYVISTVADSMTDNLLAMVENEKKYKLLEKEEYRKYFALAQNELEDNFAKIMSMQSSEMELPTWKHIYISYQQWLASDRTLTERDANSEKTWIPEEVINGWIQRITLARAENEQKIKLAMRGLYKQAQKSMRWGFIALGISLLIGILGIFFLVLYVRRPLRELSKGIKSTSKGTPGEPVRILTNDEFGELSLAFNEMTARLNEEEIMRSDFISFLSHEIRTPLTSVRESINLIREEVLGPINDRQKQFLSIAKEETEKITDLLLHLLQVSRMEAEPFEIYPQPLNPSELVQTVSQRLSPAAEAKGVKIQTDLPTKAPMVLGDVGHLEQVLINLLGNAIKFSPPSERVIIRVVPDGDQKTLKFSVSDNGPGVPENEQSLIFHKYYRTSRVKDQADGIGLGLSISKQIVLAHGGQIWVESLPGQGATFGITLPLATK